jgi:hypothetical protein
MSLVLQSSSGGQITIQEPATASNFTLDLPASTGTVLTTTSPKAGNVLQVVNATYSTELTTSSTSYISTGLTATITPTSSSSKILIIVSNMMNAPAGNNSNFTVFRGTVSGTNLTGAGGFVAFFGSGATTGVTLNYLDSPATTSAQTYTCAYKVSGGSGQVQAGSGTATMTLMEIAA